MKGIVVTPDIELTVQDFSEPLYKSVGLAHKLYWQSVIWNTKTRVPDCRYYRADEGRFCQWRAGYSRA